MNVTDLSDFTGEKRKVGIGYKYDGFDNGDISIQPGDVAVFDDPDAGVHAGDCEFIHNQVFVGYVECVYAHERDGEYSVELGVSSPLGRISVGDCYVGVVTENGVVGGMDAKEARRWASSLVNSDEYEKYYVEKWHLGRDGVDEQLWEEYRDRSRTGPNCPYCTGDMGDSGIEITGE